MLRKTLLLVISVLCIVSISWSQQNQQTAEKDNAAKLQKKALIDFANLPEELSIDRWRIQLSGFSDIPICRSLSDVLIIPVASGKLETQEKFDKCLGIRVHYEYSYNNDWAQIKTFFPLSDYYSGDGKGMLRNVGPIKSISILALGRNYKNSIEVRMVDQRGQFKSINFGALYFRDWRRLTWENPDYIGDIRKRDIVKTHLYPQYEPFLKFDSIVIYKSPQEVGGDFVCYVKDIIVEYEYMLSKYEDAVNDESIWKIQETKAQEQKMKDDRYYDMYYSGSSKEEQYLKDKAKREKGEKEVQQGTK